MIRRDRRLGRARAAGGKAEADPPSVHRDTGRLEAFSDGVFAITITLLILEIKPPADYEHLLHGLAALWPSYLAYAVTFLFIGQVWANHHVMFDHIRAADRVVLLLNTVLLMVVAFLPFATSVLAEALARGARPANRRGLLRHRVRRDGPGRSTPSGSTCAATRLLSEAPSTPRARPPSAGALNSLWPGSRPARCSAPCSLSSASR